ncbi:MAG: D-aminoacylase [Tepidanaerobacteraceae bacterium]|nr:D-aminoacylase [Tepidanaerobacteraceae bacterium]
MLDIIIKNGKIVDGTGNPWFYADIAVKDGKIAAVGKMEEAEAREVIDAKWLVVSPGFIDIHSHSDLEPMVNFRCESKARQGVTTELVGNCGDSAAPVFGMSYDQQKEYIDGHYDITSNWHTVDEYLSKMDRAKPSINYATLVGHGTLRKTVMGYERRPATKEELCRMKDLLREALRQGAFGMSTGLIYPPGCFADTGELIEISKVMAEEGGIYATHMRDEGEKLEEAVAEAIEIGRKAGVPVEISHHKACGRSYFGRVEKTLKMMEEARVEGIDVTCDVYPYTATATGLASIIPDWAHEGGMEKLLDRIQDKTLREKIKEETHPVQMALSGYENIHVSYVGSEENRKYQGASLADIGRQLGKDPLDAALDLILEEKGEVGMIRFAMDEADVKMVLSHRLSMIGSDGSALAPYGMLGKGHPHPRNYGTFPRVISRYCREFKAISLEDAVKKMTYLPACRMGLSDRGLLKEGMAADIAIFDFENIRDTATYENPHSYPDGIKYVIVNGITVIRDGEHTGERPGKALRRHYDSMPRC